VLSLFYVGGMFLNDAFDRSVDAVERPERPIPSGEIRALEVFCVGFGLLGMGIALLGAMALVEPGRWGGVAGGAVLAALVVLYDAWHKKNPWSPVIMGCCRAAIYVTAALGSGGSLRPLLALGAASLAAYVCGLTFVARQENRKSYRAGGTLVLLGSPVAVALGAQPATWMASTMTAAFAIWALLAIAPLFRAGPVLVPKAVVRLIAGISLVDGIMLAVSGTPVLASVGVLGLVATLGLQRWVRGT
jgi:4-hydroxybenzoate polyprenyltransferase